MRTMKPRSGSDLSWFVQQGEAGPVAGGRWYWNDRTKVAFTRRRRLPVGTLYGEGARGGDGSALASNTSDPGNL